MSKELEKIFAELLDANHQRIYRICKVYSVNKEDMNDLFQEVLLNIWKSLPGFRKQSEVSTWVYRIALNVCLRSRLKASKAPVLSIEDMKQERMAADHDQDEKEKHEMLYACIDKLNDTDKSLVLLYLEDLPYKAISDITGLTENHIAVKISRVKKQLFNCLTLK